MAYPKRLAAQIYKIEDSALKLYEEGLIASFKAYIPKKYSYIEVLKGLSDEGDDIKWLQTLFKRICDFAEEARLKQIPQKLATEDEEGNTIPLMVYLPEIKKSESSKA